MTFRVGQKVVCFRGSDDGDICREAALRLDYSHPQIGDVVTIKTLNNWPHKTILTFYEHDNSHIQRKLGARYEPGFNAVCFRPLVERETDISFAHEILRKVTRKQGVKA